MLLGKGPLLSSVFDGFALEQTLTASDAASADYVGSGADAVDIDTDTLIIGGWGEDGGGTDRGAAYVFTRSGSVWTEQQKLTASDAADNDYFGRAVAISGDTVVVGAYRDDSTTGAAYVFTRTAGVWSQQQKLTAGDAFIRDGFGISVDINGDTIVVGCSGADLPPYSTGTVSATNGSPTVTGSGTSWSSNVYTSAYGQAYMYVEGAGYQISSVDSDTQITLSSNFSGTTGGGKSYVIEENEGAAYVFTRTAGVWSQQQKLTAGDSSTSDSFGGSVSLSGDTVIVGVQAEETPPADRTGAAYVFTRTAGVWSQQQKLTASDLADSDYFGSCVRVDGDNAMVFSFYEDTSPNSNQGAVYIFTRSGGVWTEQQKLIPNKQNDVPPVSGKIDGTRLVVSYPSWYSGSVTNRGAVFVYDYIGTSWQKTQIIPCPENGGSKLMGSSASLDGDTIVAGAPTRGSNTGGVFVFVHT